MTGHAGRGYRREAAARTPTGSLTEHGRPTDSTAVVPDAAAWAAFWRTADRVALASWPRECVNRDVVDGGGIAVEITHRGRRLAVVTANAYPGAPSGGASAGA